VKILGCVGLVLNLVSLVLRGLVTADALWWLAPAWFVWYSLIRHSCAVRG